MSPGIEAGLSSFQSALQGSWIPWWEKERGSLDSLEAFLAGLHCVLFHPKVPVSRPNSVSLSIYLCCCVYFVVVSKEKFCLKFSGLALVELRGSRIVFLIRLCVPGCWKLPAKQTRTGAREQAAPSRGQRDTSDKRSPNTNLVRVRAEAS